MDEDLVASIDFIMECDMLEVGNGLDTLALTPKPGVMNRYQTIPWATWNSFEEQHQKQTAYQSRLVEAIQFATSYARAVHVQAEPSMEI